MGPSNLLVPQRLTKDPETYKTKSLPRNHQQIDQLVKAHGSYLPARGRRPMAPRSKPFIASDHDDHELDREVDNSRYI
jgi:hypothetical protein